MKDEMLFRIEAATANLALGIAALGLLTQEDCYPILEQLDFLYGEEEFCFQKVESEIPQNSDISRRYCLHYIIDDLKSESDRQRIKENFLQMLLNNLLRETFEGIKYYCTPEISNQRELFVAQPWYRFAKVIRNCLSHNYMINAPNKDLPVCWRSLTITKEMNNGYLEFSFLGIIQILELVKEMKEFAKNVLT